MDCSNLLEVPYEFAEKIISVVLGICLLLSMTACGAAGNTQNQSTEPSHAPEPEAEQTETAATEAKKPILLVVSFGTSYNETRDATIGAIEADLQAAYPEYEVRRAFTSQIIIDILKEREGLEIDNVTEAMERLVAEGVRDVVIQPTHVMPGYEYSDIVEEVSEYTSKFDSLTISRPLLISDEDYDAVVASLVEETAQYNTEGTAIVFMGHGTEHEANAAYERLQKRLNAAGYSNYFVGTVEGTPTVEDVLEGVRASEAQRVVLLPLMIVAGDHANNDMAGDEEDSWKTIFSNAGFEVECVLKGMGEYAGIRELLVSHARAAMEGQKDVILVVSFGTSYYETRKNTIDAIEQDIRAAYPDYEVRRAFTAQTIINILEKRDGYNIENVTQALERMVQEGVKNVILQPTHVMTGYEYDDMVAEASKFEGKFDSLKISRPVLVEDADYEALVSVLAKETEAYNADGTAVVFMGHGTEHEANATYTKLQAQFHLAGYRNYYIGTVEATPSVEDVLEAVKATDASKVVLIPLMIVAGDHANNDMAGDEEDSWKTIFTQAGYEVECVLRGMGSYPGVRQMILDHLSDTIN